MPVPVERLFAAFAGSGDPGPLGEVFDRTSPELLSLALHLCGDPGDAEDALQATFVTAIGKRAEWDRSRPLLPWLTGILVLHCRKGHERRARRREAELPELVGEDSPIVASERREMVEQLRRHVAALPEEQRQVLLLQLEHGLRPAEIAEVLGVPPGTVRMRLHRGLKALRGTLPAGLLVMLGALLPARGLAAVRQSMLGQAAALVPLVVAGGGALLMKKLAVGVAAVLVLLLGWVVADPFGGERVAPSAGAPRGQISAAADTARAIGGTTGQRVAAPPLALPGAVAAKATLVVRVVSDPAGEPLPNVPVRLEPRRSDADPWFDAVAGITDGQGTCTFQLRSEGCFQVSCVGGLRCDVAVSNGQPATAELRVPAGQGPLECIHGQVVHADGSPAGGATIVLSPSGGVEAQVAATADAAGRFELQAVAAWLMVGARLRGFAPSGLQSCRLERDIRLELRGPGAGVDGVVVDDSGVSVAGACILIGETRGRDQWFDSRGFVVAAPRPQQLVADGEGRFHAFDLPAGEIAVRVRAHWRAPLHRYLNTLAGEVTTERLELGAGCELRGTVVDGSGTPVVGANVYFGDPYGEMRTTDRDGHFGYRAAARGVQQLRVEGVDIESLHCERDFATHPGEWRVVAARLPCFLLRFVDEFGAPLPGWNVLVRASTFRPFTTDAAGRCSIPSPADKLGDLAISPPGSARATVPCAWPQGLLPAVESTIVVPSVSQPSAVITGLVRSPDGGLLAKGRVAVQRPDGSHLDWHAVAEGRFRTGMLAPGDYLLAVHREGRGAAGARFRIDGLGTGEVRDAGELRLPDESMLVLRVVHQDGSVPRAGVTHVFLFSSDREEHHAPPADGEPHPWPVGRYQWLVMADDSLWRRGSVEVLAGRTASIEVVLQPAVHRYLHFPVPTPDWCSPHRVDFVLRAPDGSEYDRNGFDPRDELPYRYMPPLSMGRWTVELATGEGRRFSGSFEVESMEKSFEPIKVRVDPAR